MVKGGECGGFAGGWLEHPRRWLGAQWAGLFLGVPNCSEAQEPTWGTAKGAL